MLTLQYLVPLTAEIGLIELVLSRLALLQIAFQSVFESIDGDT